MADKNDLARNEIDAEEAVIAPHVDIFEADDGLVLLADVPGACDEDVNVSVEEDVLTIDARVSDGGPEGVTPVTREFEPRRYHRAFSLSRDIDRQKIVGKVEQGVLEVRLPKAPEAQVRRIPISTE